MTVHAQELQEARAAIEPVSEAEFAAGPLVSVVFSRQAYLASAHSQESKRPNTM